MIKTSSRPTPEPADSAYSVPALEKGLDVLELLAGAAHGLTLKELGDRLQRTSQELFRTVSTLASRGYLLRDAAGRFRTSTKLFEMGNRHAAIQALVARAMPHMETLAEISGESCHLSMVVQDQMLVVARAECAADVKISVRVGATFELHRRVSGEVALAWLDEEAGRRYLDRQPLSPDERKKLAAKLVRIRRVGYEAADSPLMVGAQDFAAPIVDGANGLLGVLCLSRLVRVGEISRKQELIAQVCGAAAAIAAEFHAESLPIA